MEKKNHIEAAIVDLDGVITRTASRHAQAWKEMFDLYNRGRAENGAETFRTFSIEGDYPKYIDGIPRYDGVKNFLKSRNISLPYGKPDDEAGKETICGLGNWKNQIFLQIIEREGVEIFDENVEVVREWKKGGMKTAIISSSKNCKRILEAAGLDKLFEVRVDGVISQERNIKGKPDPDIFLEAARELNVTPDHALVVEDSLAGVEAGKLGNFHLVVGIINKAGKTALLDKGADEAVETLEELAFNRGKEKRKANMLPSALQALDTIQELIKKKKPVLFLDFDGTLAPIVTRHEDAIPDKGMLGLLEQVSHNYPTAIISGRDVSSLQQRIGLDNIHYAGSHGYEIVGPSSYHHENTEAKNLIPTLDEIEKEIAEELAGIDGVELERKKYALAVHYRNVPPSSQPHVQQVVDRVLKDFKKIKRGTGKKVIELQPGTDWHKGKAVEKLVSDLNSHPDAVLPIYVGDDITDEDAFAVMGKGLAILVGDHGEETQADYHLEDVEEVKEFLDWMLTLKQPQ